METTKWYNSRTVRLAILQAVLGIVTALIAEDPNIQSVGTLAILKSVLDFSIRYTTSGTKIK